MKEEAATKIEYSISYLERHGQEGQKRLQSVSLVQNFAKGSLFSNVTIIHALEYFWHLLSDYIKTKV